MGNNSLIWRFLLAITALGALLVWSIREPDDIAISGEPTSPSDILGLHSTPLPWHQSAAPTTLSAKESAANPSPNHTPATRASTVVDQLRQHDGWTLMSIHWPRARSGDADSQLIVYSVMSSCRVYRWRFEGKTIAEVRAEFSRSRDPALVLLNENVWEECGQIYASWDRFDGWQEMLDAAADNGQPLAMIRKGEALISDADTFDEGVSLLNAAIQDEDLFALALMTDVYIGAGIDKNVAYGWLLAACELGLDCSPDGIFMSSMCNPFSEACTPHESVTGMSLRELGDGGLYVANQEAERIYRAIASGRLEDLDLAAELKNKGTIGE